MTETPIQFEPAPAIRAAGDAIHEKASDVRREVEAEVEVAAAVAARYASHLSDGGDPLGYTTSTDGSTERDRFRSGGGGHKNISPFLGLIVVYRAWNAERGNPHGVLPFQNHHKWAVAERLTAEVGAPVSYQDLCATWITVGGRRVENQGSSSSTKPASDMIASTAVEIESASEGRHVARRTKVDGKVGFLIRERRADDPEAGSYRSYSLPEETA